MSPFTTCLAKTPAGLLPISWKTVVIRNKLSAKKSLDQHSTCPPPLSASASSPTACSIAIELRDGSPVASDYAIFDPARRVPKRRPFDRPGQTIQCQELVWGRVVIHIRFTERRKVQMPRRAGAAGLGDIGPSLLPIRTDNNDRQLQISGLINDSVNPGAGSPKTTESGRSDWSLLR